MVQLSGTSTTTRSLGFGAGLSVVSRSVASIRGGILATIPDRPYRARLFDRPAPHGDPVLMGAATDHVVINLTIQSSGLARQGFGIPLILSHTASFVQRIR